MKINRFKYEREALEAQKWNSINIDWIELQDINLIVGKNASGKSTIVNTLSTSIKIILPTNVRYIGKRNLELENVNGDIFRYYFESSIEGITHEELYKNGTLLLQRAGPTAKIFSEVKQEFEEINPPSNKAIIQVRRDAKEYPYLEELATWAEGVRFFKFGNIHPYSTTSKLPEDIGFSSDDFNKALENLSSNDKKNLIKEFNSLGYDVKVIDIQKEFDRNFILVREGELEFPIRQHLL